MYVRDVTLTYNNVNSKEEIIMGKVNDILLKAAENYVMGHPTLSVDDAIHYILYESDLPFKYWVEYKEFDTLDDGLSNIIIIQCINEVETKKLFEKLRLSMSDSLILYRYFLETSRVILYIYDDTDFSIKIEEKGGASSFPIV